VAVTRDSPYPTSVVLVEKESFFGALYDIANTYEMSFIATGGQNSRCAAMAYVEQLKRLPGLKADSLMGPNTIRKHCVQLQHVLDLAGPRGREQRTAQNLLEEVPYLERPSAWLKECEEVFEELYAIKNEKQIDILKKVARAAEKAIKEGFETIRPDMNEYELARIMINRFYSEGGDGIRLLIVGSGERSSYPNVGPSDRVIKKGDLIRVDFLGLSEYFMSDVCRTAVVGEPTEKQRRTWHKLVETKDKMLKLVKPGVKAYQVYNAYLKIWTSFGFKPVRFIGHGLGLSTHERPLLSDFDKLVLQEGMVLCIEPLLLIPGVEGYHVEDEILITKDGYEILTDLMNTSELYEIR